MCLLFYRRYQLHTRPILYALALLTLTLFFTALAQAALSDISRIYRAPLIISNVNGQSQIQFEICSGGGCAALHVVTLSLAELAPIVEIFAAKNLESTDEAVTERTHIAQAIGALENIIGLKPIPTKTAQVRLITVRTKVSSIATMRRLTAQPICAC